MKINKLIKRLGSRVQSFLFDGENSVEFDSHRLILMALCQMVRFIEKNLSTKTLRKDPIFTIIIPLYLC